MVKLETRIPAGFLNGITALVPQVSGFNIEVRLHVCTLTRGCMHIQHWPGAACTCIAQSAHWSKGLPCTMYRVVCARVEGVEAGSVEDHVIYCTHGVVSCLSTSLLPVEAAG